MRIQTDNDFYRTADFPLAATISVSIPLAAVDRTNPRRTCFVFERSNQLDDVIEQYHRRELRIEPQAFYSSIRMLKARLYGDV